MNEKLRQKSAFPFEPDYMLDENETRIIYKESKGMSKRFYAACAAMQGLIINFPKERMVNDGYIAISDYPELVKESYQIADELLKQEDI